MNKKYFVFQKKQNSLLQKVLNLTVSAVKHITDNETQTIHSSIFYHCLSSAQGQSEAGVTPSYFTGGKQAVCTGIIPKYNTQLIDSGYMSIYLLLFTHQNSSSA